MPNSDAKKAANRAYSRRRYERLHGVRETSETSEPSETAEAFRESSETEEPESHTETDRESSDGLGWGYIRRALSHE